ncbi:hypothetical protein K402DRAFT_460876 [Aulographum hederae CBS 113979]|uniref:Uncharacterized protein n=1 Tax=Aulographum hederae CBS 113979 TaxID=1176131 RepID=A0A6G1HAD0_9PEZI|nr:hypothetical protein K402DRAFT_460876 [Aulographum hederae CBS 113979]
MSTTPHQDLVTSLIKIRTHLNTFTETVNEGAEAMNSELDYVFEKIQSQEKTRALELESDEVLGDGEIPQQEDMKEADSRSKDTAKAAPKLKDTNEADSRPKDTNEAAPRPEDADEVVEAKKALAANGEKLSKALTPTNLAWLAASVLTIEGWTWDRIDVPRAHRSAEHPGVTLNDRVKEVEKKAEDEAWKKGMVKGLGNSILVPKSAKFTESTGLTKPSPAKEGAEKNDSSSRVPVTNTNPVSASRTPASHKRKAEQSLEKGDGESEKALSIWGRRESLPQTTKDRMNRTLEENDRRA